jgi:hypothetical protein
MTPQHPMCRAIEPDLLSDAAGETDSAAAGRVQTHVGGCQLCRDELAHYALEGVIDSLRRAPLADDDATLARAAHRAPLGSALTRAASSEAAEVCPGAPAASHWADSAMATTDFSQRIPSHVFARRRVYRVNERR